MKKLRYILIIAFSLSCILFLVSCDACDKGAKKLSAPANLQINEKVLTWDSVDNASGYLVQIDSETPVDNGTATEYSLSELTVVGTYYLKVMAKGDGINYSDSNWSSIKSYEIKNDTLNIDSAKIDEVVEAIDVLPPLAVLRTTHKEALDYVLSLYNALNAEEKLHIKKYNKLLTAVNYVDDLISGITYDYKYELGYSYLSFSFDGSQNFEMDYNDINFNVNPTSWNLGDDSFELLPIDSELAALRGQVFTGWYVYMHELNDGGGGSTRYLHQIFNLDELPELMWYNSTVIIYAKFEYSKTVTLNFYDKADSQALLTTIEFNRSWDLYWKEIEPMFQEQISISGKYPTKYYSFESGYYIEIDNYKYNGHTFPIIKDIYVDTVASYKITLSNECDWSLQCHYNDENIYINKTEYSGTEFWLPKGTSITIASKNTDLIDILVDGEIEDSFIYYGYYNFTLNADTEIAFNIKQPKEISRLVFISEFNYAYIDQDLSFNKNSSEWTGDLSETDLLKIKDYCESDDYFTTYKVNGISLNFTELCLYRFETEPETIIINVTRVSAIYTWVFFTDTYHGSAYNILGIQVNAKKTLQEYLKDSSAIYLFKDVVLYLNEERTIPFTEDITTYYPEDNLQLYVKHSTGFTVSFEMNGGSAVAPIYVPAYNYSNNFSIIEKIENLKKPEKSGYLFLGWSLADGGEILPEFYARYVLLSCNQNITLYAVWVEFIPQASELEGSWISTDSDDMLVFNADGTGYFTRFNDEFAYTVEGNTLTLYRSQVLAEESYSVLQSILQFDLTGRLNGEVLDLSEYLYFGWSEYKRCEDKIVLIEIQRFNYGDTKFETIYLNENTRLSNIFSYGYIYHNKNLIENWDSMLKDLAVEGKVELQYFYSYACFIDLDTQGGILHDGLSPDINTTFDLSKYTPAKSGMVFLGWYTMQEGGNLITYLYELKNYSNIDVIILYAHYIPWEVVDYSENEIVGKWTKAYYDTYGYLQIEFTFYANGTFNYLGYANGIKDYNMSGAYRIINGEIKFFNLKNDFTNEYELSVFQPNINLQFLSINVISIQTQGFFIKENIKPISYENEDFLGAYVINGFEGFEEVFVELYADGTAIINRYNEDELIYYRIIENNLYVFIPCELFTGTAEVPKIFSLLELIVKVPESYENLSILGNWEAGDPYTQAIIDSIYFDEEGRITLPPSMLSNNEEMTLAYGINGNGYFGALLNIGNKLYFSATISNDTLTIEVFRITEDYNIGEMLLLPLNFTRSD